MSSSAIYLHFSRTMEAFRGVFAHVPGFEHFPIFREYSKTSVSMTVRQITHSAGRTHVIAGVTQLPGAEKERKTQGSWRKWKPFGLDPGVQLVEIASCLK